MKPKRPRTVLILIAIFSWSLLKGLEFLARGSTTADRILFDQVGLAWLSIGFLAVIALLDLTAIGYLLKPAPVGWFVCLGSIALSALHTGVGFAIARAHPDVARRAFTVSREARGLPVRPEAIDAAVDPTMSLLLWVGSLVVSGVLAFLVIWNRDYFFRSTPAPGDVVMPHGR